MNVENFMEQMICERIEILIKKRPELFMKKNREIFERQEAVIGNLDRETRIAIENLIDDLIAQTAEENRYLYLEGIEDGMKIAKIVLKAWGNEL